MPGATAWLYAPYQMLILRVIFQQQVTTILVPRLQTFHPPSGERPRLKKHAVEIIEAHFKDYKSQINNRIAGIGHPTKVGIEIGGKAVDNDGSSSSLSRVT